MANPIGLFDKHLVLTTWFDAAPPIAGWFDESLVSSGGSANQTLTPVIFNNSNSFYSATITTGGATQNLTAGLFTSSNTFYAATLVKGAVNLTPGLYANSNTFNAHTVAASITLNGTRLDNTSVFYAGSLGIGEVNLTAGLFASANTFYAATIGQGSIPQTLTAGLFTNSSQFFNGTISGLISLTASQYDNAGSFYAASVVSSITLAATRLDNTNSFYAASVYMAGDQALTHELFQNQPEFYSAAISDGKTSSPAPVYIGGGGWKQAGLWSDKIINSITLSTTPFENSNSFYSASLNLKTETPKKPTRPRHIRAREEAWLLSL